jgi:hypothetical protein
MSKGRHIHRGLRIGYAACGLWSAYFAVQAAFTIPEIGLILGGMLTAVFCIPATYLLAIALLAKDSSFLTRRKRIRRTLAD